MNGMWHREASIKVEMKTANNRDRNSRHTASIFLKVSGWVRTRNIIERTDKKKEGVRSAVRK